MLMTYVFTLDSVFKSDSSKTQNFDKPVWFAHIIVLLIYVNESIYLLGNLPFFKIHVNHFMAWDSSPCTKFSSVQSLSCVPLFTTHESQHARPPCPSPTPRVHSDPRPSSQWCHPAISSSVVPFSYCPQCLPASGSFPMSQLFAWGGQSTGVLALASFLPKNTQGWSPLEWTGWISFQSKGLSRYYEMRLLLIY